MRKQAEKKKKEQKKKEKIKKELFPEDVSPISSDTESSEGESTLSAVNIIKKAKLYKSPSSSPLPDLPIVEDELREATPKKILDTTLVISSDSELKSSMVDLEKSIAENVKPDTTSE